MRCKRGLAVAVLLGAVFGAGALQTDQGRIRLVLDEESGRFSVLYRTDNTDRVFQPLLVAEDPRTSSLSIREENRVHIMGAASGFTQTVRTTEAGAVFVWTSSTLEVTQEFFFVASPGTALANGIRIDVTVRNLSDRTREIAARTLLDTYLGEEEGPHFVISTGEPVDRERELLEGSTVSYWVSPGVEASLRVPLIAQGVTTPDKVVFANWKRLSDSTWDYQANRNRNFNLLPYSVNDSAVMHYYGPKAVAPGSVFAFTLVLGEDNLRGFDTEPVTRVNEITEILEQATAPPEVADRALALRQSLATVDNLLEQINRKLESGEISEEDVAVVEQIISELRRKHPF